MKQDKEILFLKFAAVALTAYYLYRVSKASGGTLSGNPYGINVNEEKILDLGLKFVPPEWRSSARTLGQAWIDNRRGEA